MTDEETRILESDYSPMNLIGYIQAQDARFHAFDGPAYKVGGWRVHGVQVRPVCVPFEPKHSAARVELVR